MAQTLEWAQTGRISSNFLPVAYPLFSGIGYRIAGMHGIIVMQVILYLLIVLFSFMTLTSLRLPRVWAAIATLPIAMNPDLLLSIHKFWDVPLSIFFCVVLLLLFVQIQKNLRPSLILITGIAFGAAVFTRPNLEFLAAVAFLIIWRAPETIRMRLFAFAGFATISIITFGLLGIAGHGRVFFPENGPYNLYVGNNAFSAGALLHNFNGEPSIYAAVAADTGLTEFMPSPCYSADVPPRPTLFNPCASTLQSFYTRQGLRFGAFHPIEEVKLVFLKLITLLRPDTRLHPLLTSQGLVKLVVSLPIFLAVFSFIANRHLRADDDWLFAIFVLCYTLPFLITNSDPRFRIPLDFVALLYIASIWSRRLVSRPALKPVMA